VCCMRLTTLERVYVSLIAFRTDGQSESGSISCCVLPFGLRRFLAQRVRLACNVRACYPPRRVVSISALLTQWVAEKVSGSSGRTRTYNPSVNSRCSKPTPIPTFRCYRFGGVPGQRGNPVRTAMGSL
jgi:hypothetical protein